MMNFDIQDIESSRNYTMKSSATELMVYGKYYFIEDIVRRHTQFKKDDLKLIKPFVSLGFTPVIFNATTTDTLNQERSTSGIAVAVPFVGGMQFGFTHRVSLLLDITYRYVLSDQLDAYGTEEGGGNANDSYATIGLTLQYSPFAKRAHKKKFKAPKDAQEQHYGTGSTQNEQNNTGAPVEENGSSNEDATNPKIDKAIAPGEEDTENTIEEEPEYELQNESSTEEDEIEDNTEGEDEYYEEEEEESSDDSYDDGW